MQKKLLLIVLFSVAFFLPVPPASEVRAEVMKALQITSAPSGAEVFLKKASREIHIGKTPLTYKASFHSEMSILRMVFKKQGYNDRNVEVKASEGKVRARLSALQITANADNPKGTKLGSLEKRIYPIIDKTLPQLLQKKGKFDYNLSRPVQIKRMEHKTYVVISILLQDLKDKFETKGKERDKELMKKGWKQFGPSLVIPLAKALKDQRDLHGIVLDLNYDRRDFTFNVNSSVVTNIEMECFPGYDQQEQYTTCWQNGSPYSCTRLVSVYNPCKYRRPVTKRKLKMDPQTGATKGKALVRYMLPLSRPLSKVVPFNQVGALLKDPEGKTLFTQGAVP